MAELDISSYSTLITPVALGVAIELVGSIHATRISFGGKRSIGGSSDHIRWVLGAVAGGQDELICAVIAGKGAVGSK